MNGKNQISVHHEWGKLKEVIVGIGDDLVVPSYYEGLSYFGSQQIEEMKKYGGSKLNDIHPKLAKRVIEQANGLAKVLEDRGVIVHRCHLLHPEEKKYLDDVQKGLMPLFPRDPILVIGNNVIELSLRNPMRRKERYGIRPILESILRNSNANFVAVPPASPQLDDKGPFLEGGDVLLNGYEIYVGNSGRASNKAGIEWLRKYLGPKYKVHKIRVDNKFVHLDAVLALIRPGLGIIYREGIKDELPKSLENWDFIAVDSEEEANRLAANALVLDEKTVIIDNQHHRIAEELRKKGQEVIEILFSAVVIFGGSLRCAHHPLRRESKLK
jgi:glycine amidinotransferase